MHTFFELVGVTVLIPSAFFFLLWFFILGFIVIPAILSGGV